VPVAFVPPRGLVGGGGKCIAATGPGIRTSRALSWAPARWPRHADPEPRGSVRTLPHHAAMLTLADSVFAANLLSPPILFFFLGMLAAVLKSGLEIPAAFTKALSLYLLWAIGFKGVMQLQDTGLGPHVLVPVLVSVAISAIIPCYVFPLMRWKLGTPTAAAVAATYGSVSVVTFLAATTLLEESGIKHGGYMVAATALMESPAVMVSVLLARFFSSPSDRSSPRPSTRRIAHDALLNSAVVLLVGSLLIGYFSVDKSHDKVLPLSKDLFYGLLCFFLLDLGLVAGKNVREPFKAGPVVVLGAVAIPLVNACVGAMGARLAGMPFADGFLLITLAASGSYIAVPAAMKLALPEARQEVFVPMSLALTFPFNVTVGLPLYWKLAEMACGSP